MRKLNRPNKHFEFDSSTDNEKWTVEKFRVVFKNVQFDKCGYCEYDQITGDMDHYRPKARIDRLIDDDPYLCYERPGVPYLEKNSRQVEEVRNYGYYWLENDWNNFVYSCKLCNSTYKKCLFPVDGPRQHRTNYQVVEDSLILNPYEDKNPNDHLDFYSEGQISPHNNSKYGKQTILCCGLSRETLTLKRKMVAVDIYELIIEAQEAVSDEVLKNVIKNILRIGKDSARFSGMVRNIFEKETGIPWEELEGLIV